MKGKSLRQIKQELGTRDAEILNNINITILRNVVVDPIGYYLQYYAYKSGFNLNVCMGEYDQIFQNSNSPQDGLITKKSDFILVFFRLENASPKLSYDFSSQTATEINSEIKRIYAYVEGSVCGIRASSNAMILWHGFEAPLYSSLGIIEDQKNGGIISVIDEVNQGIRDILGQHSQSYFIDINKCVARIGHEKFYDDRYWHIGKAPYSLVAYQELSCEFLKYLRAAMGLNKKCLVLDCDNTLWGGIVGEDGVTGIQISEDYPGCMYREIQYEVRSLQRKGVVLCICSKNNEEDVAEVFEAHPGMVLKKSDISAFRVNWKNKASNLVDLSNELNIGLDSFVFIDDSKFEIDLIKENLPEVETIHFNSEKKLTPRKSLNERGFFDSLHVSSEDSKRTEMYQAEAKRKRCENDFMDVGAYLKSLDMEVEIGDATDISIPRLAQLSQKTNQFNLTTKRYSEADISALNNKTNRIYYLSLRDKFGDYGIVGACIIKLAAGTAEIDTFLVSCRALGRRVEDVFISIICHYIHAENYTVIIGRYRPTNKNKQVESFYLKHLFKEVSRDNRQVEYKHVSVSEINNFKETFKKVTFNKDEI